MNKRFIIKPGSKSVGKIIRIWKKNNGSMMRYKYPVKIDECADYVPDAVEIPWKALSDGPVADLWVEAVNPSGSLGDITINASVKEGDKEDDPTVDDEIRMTAIQITAEPITAEQQNGMHPFNPAGIVKGESAKFRIDVKPSDYPNNEIQWEANGRGSCGSTDSSGTTRWADFTANSAGGGYVIPLVKGNYYTDPIFPIQVFDAWSDVTMNVFIAYNHPVPPAKDGIPALDPALIASIVDPVNEIFKQAGIRFNPVIMPWATGAGKGEAYYNIPDKTSAISALANSPKGAGVRVIFVYSLPDTTAGWHFPTRGTLCETDSYSGIHLAKVLAHELGHACGLEDIYADKWDKDGGMPPWMGVNKKSKAQYDWSASDWPENGGLNCQPAYYSRFDSGKYINSVAPDTYATRQVDLVQRLFMHGHVHPDNLDIPLGKVYGVCDGYGPGRELNIGQAEVGITDMDRSPEH